MAKFEPWWAADEGEVNKRVVQYVSEVERVQIAIYERFMRLTALYDPNDRSAWDRESSKNDVAVSENVIASNVDTVHATIAATEVRARFVTDDGDWSMQRTASRLGLYAEGLGKLLGINIAAETGFKHGALKGTGLVKVYTDEFDSIKVEHTLVDDIIVDEMEVRAGKPRQMHQRMFVSRDVLTAKFPEHADEIERSQTSGRASGGGSWRYWASYRPIERDEVVVIESWHLPIGVEGKKGYVCGRHTITIDGCDLFDEEYEKTYFPFARFAWSERTTGWYAVGLAERILGHQRQLNKLNIQHDRALDQVAWPTTWVRPADANMTVRSTNRFGSIGVYKAELPKTVTPQAVSPEFSNRMAMIKEGSYEETGLSRMAAQSKKPAGLDSGVALREYRDQSTQRFAMQEKGFERFVLDIYILVIACAKELGVNAPVVIRKSKNGPRKIEWSDVDLGEVKVQIAAGSSLNRTPAGRVQTAMEAAQAGVISTDAARRMMDPNGSLDIAGELSMFAAAIDDIDACIEEILDGAVLVPEPYQNLKMGIWRMNQAQLKARRDGAGEDVLENLRQWISQAAYIQGQAEAPAAPAPAPGMDAGAMQPGAPGADMGAPMPGGPMPPPGPGPANYVAPPANGAVMGALAPTAMNTLAH